VVQCDTTWQPLTGSSVQLPFAVQGRREEYTRTIEPARALAAETLKLESTLSDLVNQANGLTAAEIDLMWKTAPHCVSIPPHFPSSGMPK